MKTYERQGAIEIFDEFWDELKESWFKVEVLQDYSAEDAGPSLDAWKAGNKEKSIELAKEQVNDSEWIETNKGKSHIKKTRIHIVEKPYTPYLEWELEIYKIINIPLVGEKVYLVNKADVSDLDIPDGDFMIFDGKRVVKNTYNSDGKMTSADVYTEEDDISKFLELREKLLKYTVNS